MNRPMAHKPFDMRIKPAPASANAGFESHIKAIAENKDRESFVQLFEHFAPRVKSFLMKGGTPEDTADELAQETMLAVWDKATSFDPARASPATWIYTIARNKKIDLLRKSGRLQAGSPDELDLLPSNDAAPGSDLMHAEETDAIAEAIKTLPAEQAELLQKSFFEGKSHHEIADESGLPLGTVKSRIRLALKRLRKNRKVSELWQ